MDLYILCIFNISYHIDILNDSLIARRAALVDFVMLVGIGNLKKCDRIAVVGCIDLHSGLSAEDVGVTLCLDHQFSVAVRYRCFDLCLDLDDIIVSCNTIIQCQCDPSVIHLVHTDHLCSLCLTDEVCKGKALDPDGFIHAHIIAVCDLGRINILGFSQGYILTGCHILRINGIFHCSS